MVIMVILYFVFNSERIRLVFNFEIIPPDSMDKIKVRKADFELYYRKIQEKEVKDYVRRYNWYIIEDPIVYNEGFDSYSMEKNLPLDSKDTASIVVEMDKKDFRLFAKEFNLSKVY